MDCPVCKKAMIVLEVDRVETDHCVQCGGTWLDGGELELLLEGAANRDDLLARLVEVDAPGEAGRACPICDKKMVHVAPASAGGEPPVIIDKCRRNDGIWFDAGELGQIIRLGEFPADSRILKLLTETFVDR